MYPQGRHPAPHQPGQPGFKFTVAESCDRIKDEFQFLQAQYHSLKVEYDKLANEKTEMQRHYVMYYEMSYGLNIEMHKQTEIAKRLNAILAQIMPFLSQEHQQQVAQAVERAKQVTMTELNAIIGGSLPFVRENRERQMPVQVAACSLGAAHKLGEPRQASVQAPAPITPSRYVMGTFIGVTWFKRLSGPGFKPAFLSALGF
ncbi:hypothetical protein SKAU_G00317610 [Synaphobranchus kaupii]|uniref:Groucho/TLE N-terminal Q-rich domain-containing protein n=1 Tax=Synaphobranchus kaupii TaxID=118154 RepID=A0A9Q1ET06_SYNKA|nr:hypothetical protein SKAU_G00317610 [Synaphobranchus kaupii]